MTQKYFWGALDSEHREASLKELLNRVVNQIVNWGDKGGYFASNDEKNVFADELMSLLLVQKASFNSPVWFNIGVPGVPQQSSACFILSVDDTIDRFLTGMSKKENLQRWIWLGANLAEFELVQRKSQAEVSQWSSKFHARRRC